MAAKLKTYFSLLSFYARMDFQWLLQDTGFCLTCILAETLSTVSAVLGVFLLALRFDGIGGFSADEMLFLLGFYTCVSGIGNLAFSGNNVGDISRRVGRGQLDHMLIQPLPLPLQLLTEGFLPFSGCGPLLAGLTITVSAILRLGLSITPLWVLQFLLFLFSATFLLLGVSYVFGSLAFLYPAGAEEISGLATDVLRTLAPYPLSALPALLKGALCTVVPAGALSFLPSLVLLQKAGNPLELSFYLPLLTALVCGLASFIFRKGLKLYAKFGSRRYRSMGHRS